MGSLTAAVPGANRDRNNNSLWAEATTLISSTPYTVGGDLFVIPDRKGLLTVWGAASRMTM
jgi:hypothetical protein